MSTRSRSVAAAIAAWDTAWKAAAIRRALRNGQKRWALVLLLVSSAGVLPMLYLSLWSKPQAGRGPTSS